MIDFHHIHILKLQHFLIYFLIGGKWLHSVVLVSAIQQGTSAMIIHPLPPQPPSPPWRWFWGRVGTKSSNLLIAGFAVSLVFR